MRECQQCTGGRSVQEGNCGVLVVRFTTAPPPSDGPVDHMWILPRSLHCRLRTDTYNADMRASSPTIGDVAERAGVSKSTVSLAINDPERVGGRTLAAVQEAMAELGYKPRRNRRRRREVDHFQVRLESVALLFPDPDAASMRTPLAAALAHGIEAVCHEQDAALLVTHLRDRETLPRLLTSGSVNGVVIRAATMLPAVEQLRHLPTVWAFELHERPAWGDHAHPDHGAIGQLAANHLFERGHRRLTILLNRQRGQRNPAFTMRAQACREAFRRAGGRVKELELAFYDCPAGELPAECRDLPTEAVFVADQESIAERFHRALLAGHCECDVVGQTQDPSRLEPLGPRFAAIDIQPEQVGRTAAELLVWRLANPAAPQRKVLIAPGLITESDA